MTRSTLRAILFDFNGVISDDEPLHAQSAIDIAARHGIQVSHERYFERHLGKNDRDCFTGIWADAERTLGAEALAGLVEEKAQRYMELVGEDPQIFPDIDLLIRSLQEQVPLAIVSGALRSELEFFLEKVGLRDAFKVIISADDVVHGKPHPEGYQRAIAALSAEMKFPLANNECLIIEDSPLGVAAAREIGTPSLAVVTSKAKEELEEATWIKDRLVGMRWAGLLDLWYEPTTPERPLHLNRKPHKGLQMVVNVEGLNHKGYGLSTLHCLIGPQKMERKYHLEIRGGLPGERVLVRTELLERRTLHVGVVERLKASPLRKGPRCLHFGPREISGKGCGGCAIQDLRYEDQLALKRETVAQTFARRGLEIEIPEVLGMETPWFYRNKMEYTFGDNRERVFALGLRPLGYRREVIRMEHCFLQSAFSAQLVVGVRQWAEGLGLHPVRYRKNDAEGYLRNLTVREGKRTQERLVSLITTDADEVYTKSGMRPAEEIARDFAAFVQGFALREVERIDSVIWVRHSAHRGQPTKQETIVLKGSLNLKERLHLSFENELEFEIHPLAFFQPNTLGAEVLYREVGKALEPDEETLVYDLYCGTGTIGLSLARSSARVFGVELNAEAVANARRNASRNGLDNVTFKVGDVGKVVGQEAREMGQGLRRVVVVDPPRTGLRKEAHKVIDTLSPQRLVYVSCNPDTLARDLSLLKAKGWTIASVQPVDMFPHTGHIECVVRLDAPSGQG